MEIYNLQIAAENPKVEIPEHLTSEVTLELVKEGKVRALGLSECSSETLRRAHSVHPISALQSELSLWTQFALNDHLPVCKELSVTYVAYSPLGRGMLTGAIKSDVGQIGIRSCVDVDAVPLTSLRQHNTHDFVPLLGRVQLREVYA